MTEHSDDVGHYTETDGPDKKGGSGRGTISILVTAIFLAVIGSVGISIWAVTKILPN